MDRHEVSDAQLRALLAGLRADGVAVEPCTLAGLPALLEHLHATRGYPATRHALQRATIPLCEMCARDARATPAVVYAELDTGMRSVGAFMHVCDACVPRVYELPP